MMALNRFRTLALLLAASFIAACSSETEPPPPPQPEPVATELEAAPPATLGGTVTDVRSAMGYTYAEVDTGTEKVWVAGPSTGLEPGDSISFPTSMPMRDFHSNSMNRDFDVLYFTNAFANAGGEPIGMGGHGGAPDKASSAKQAPAPAAKSENDKK